jgi:topoisomerase IA-like protein
MATNKPTIQIGDDVREMTDAEHAQYLLDQQEAEQQAQAAADRAKARAAALAKLGLTADEAAALFG